MRILFIGVSLVAALFAATAGAHSRCEGQLQSKRSSPGAWDKAAIKRALRALYVAGKPCNADFLSYSKDIEARNIVVKALGFETSLQRIYFWAVRLYDDFPAALKAAKIPVERVVLRPDQEQVWTKENVRNGLQALGRHGYPLTTAELKILNTPEATQLLFETLGFRARPRTLLEKATRFFGTLQAALWTEDTVAKALNGLHLAGYRPNANFFKITKATPEIAAVIQAAIGFPADLHTVLRQSVRIYGDYKTALKKSGLEIVLKRQSQPWSAELTHKCLNALYANGFIPKITFLQSSKDRRAAAIVCECAGFKTTLTTLLNKAREFHGGDFNLALEKSGLSLDEILKVSKRTPWTKELTHRGLQALFKAGFVPRAIFLQRSEDAQALKVLRAAVGFETQLSSLYLKAVEFHLQAGQEVAFQLAVESAGLPVEQVVGKFSNRMWTAESVHRALRALFESGYIPSAGFLIHSPPTLELQKIIKEALGFPATTPSLYKQAQAFHEGDFQKAILAAGLPMDKVVERYRAQDLSREDMRRGLLALYNARLFPSASLFDMRDAAVEEVLFKELGIPVSTRHFYVRTKEEYGGRWSQALQAAQLPLAHWISYWTRERIAEALSTLQEGDDTPEPSQGLTAEQVLIALRELYEQNILYNANLAARNSRKTRAAVAKAVGFKCHSRFLLEQAKLQFGSLRQALVAAELPADEIITYRNRDIDFTAGMATQTERIVENGQVRYQTYLGVAPLNPEEQILKSEAEEEILKSLPPELRETGEKIVAAIFALEGDDIGSADVLAAIAKTGVSTVKAQRTLRFLRENVELKKLLLGDD